MVTVIGDGAGAAACAVPLPVLVQLAQRAAAFAPCGVDLLPLQPPCGCALGGHPAPVPGPHGPQKPGDAHPKGGDTGDP